MSDNQQPPPPARWRTVLVVVGVVAAVTILGMSWLRRHPNAFDREQVNPQLMAELQAVPIAPPAATAGWPQWRGPNRDGVAPTQAIRTNWTDQPPAKLWSVPCRGGYSTVIVADGRAYTTDFDGTSERILAIDAITGHPHWEYASPADYSMLKLGYQAGPRATPTVADGRLYMLGTTGTFLCLQLPTKPGESPRELWRHDLLKEFDAELPQWGFASSPLIQGDLVIVQPGGRRGSVVAFDRISGELRWTADNSPSGYSSPIGMNFRDTPLIVAMTGRDLLGIRAADGEIQWKHPWPVQQGINNATPLILDDNIFVSSGYTKGAALLHLEPRGADIVAKTVYFRPNKLMRNHHSTCVHKDGYLYGFDNAEMACIDVRQGTRMWDTTTVGKGSVIRCGDYLIGLTERGQAFVAAASPEDFSLLGRFQALDGGECWAAPTLVEGRLYLRDHTAISCWDVTETKP